MGLPQTNSPIINRSICFYLNFESRTRGGLWVCMCVCEAWRERHVMGLSLVFLSCFYFFTWPLLFISFSLSLYLSTLPLICSAVNLIPITPIVEERPFRVADGGVGVALGKSRKRVFPVPHSQEPNPISEAYGYCNTPNRTEQAWEGETCTLTNNIYSI